MGIGPPGGPIPVSPIPEMVLFEALLWLIVIFAPFLILQRSLHREAQAIFLLITRRSEISIMLFSLLFFPGVFLHEISHYVMARLLGVRTGRLSIFPRPLADGRLQLGYVETAPADWVRDSLIGAAPLLAGGAFVAYAGLQHLGLYELWEAIRVLGVEAALDVLPGLYRRPDFWLWFYLTFAVSSTMMPSSSDRRAWLPLSMVFGILLAVGIFAGAGPWLAVNLMQPLIRLLQALLIVFGISLFLHGLLLVPAWGLRQLISRLTGLRVVR